MRNSILAGLLALLFSATSGFAQQGRVLSSAITSEPGKVSATEVVKGSATVTAIDSATRTVTLKDAEGSSVEVVAGDAVKNFSQIKVGDKVLVEYIQELSMEVKKGNGIRERIESETETRAEPGETPAGKLGRQVTIIADVIDVNPAKKTITVKGPKGKIAKLNVKNPDQFKVVKKGDQIKAVYVEALAIAIAPASKKDAKS